MLEEKILDANPEIKDALEKITKLLQNQTPVDGQCIDRIVISKPDIPEIIKHDDGIIVENKEDNTIYHIKFNRHRPF